MSTSAILGSDDGQVDVLLSGCMIERHGPVLARPLESKTGIVLGPETSGEQEAIVSSGIAG